MAIILGLTGEKLGGKDTAVGYLMARYNAAHVKYSHVLDDILNILDLPVSRHHDIILATGLRQMFGSDIVARGLAKRITNITADVIVLNGMRDLEEIPWVRKVGAKIVYITAPTELRYQRFLQRREKQDDGQQTWEEFLSQEQAATEVQIPAIGEQADFRIENTGTVEELQAKIDAIMDELKSS